MATIPPRNPDVPPARSVINVALLQPIISSSSSADDDEPPRLIDPFSFSVSWISPFTACPSLSHTSSFFFFFAQKLQNQSLFAHISHVATNDINTPATAWILFVGAYILTNCPKGVDNNVIGMKSIKSRWYECLITCTLCSSSGCGCVVVNVDIVS